MKYINKPIHMLNIQEIHYETMNKVVKQIKPTKSSGIDLIQMKTIKELGSLTIPLLHHLYNSIIKTKIYPKILKCSKAIPILKKNKERSNPNSYSLIHLLTTISKNNRKSYIN